MSPVSRRWFWVLLGLLIGAASFGQTVQPTVLYSFPAASQNPMLGAATTTGFYGTTASGGTNGGFGTFFKLTTNGIFTTLASVNSSNSMPTGTLYPYQVSQFGLPSYGGFYGISVNGGLGYGTVMAFATNSYNGDPASTNWNVGTIGRFNGYSFGTLLLGASPSAGFFQSNSYGGGNALYGTAYSGGTNNFGMIFAAVLDTSGLITRVVPVASFNNTNGANPAGQMWGNYGTTVNGGAHSCGTVFQFATNGVITTLASFNQTNGANPVGAIIETSISPVTLCGTTSNGGTYGYGTVFSLVGSNLTTLASFNYTNGANPSGGISVDGQHNMYGTTMRGGTGGGYGTIYKLTNGGGVGVLHSFNGSDGAYPTGNFLLGADGLLYGTTQGGGVNGGGTIFRISMNGVFTTMVSLTNTAGCNPYGPLMQGADGSLYGTATSGGVGGISGGNGIIYRIWTNGNYAPLATFGGTNGADPVSTLAQNADGTLWGTTCLGGTGNYGTIFQLTTNGNLMSIFSFNGLNGANPYAGLTLASDGNFYGTTFLGGASNSGTVFRITPSGSFASLTSFSYASGQRPYGGVVQGSDGYLYGTTYQGGANNYGTFYRITTNGVFTLLQSFPNQAGNPLGTLILGTDGNFYGTGLEGPFPPFSIVPFVFRATPTGSLSLAGFVYSASSATGTMLLANDGKFYFTSVQNTDSPLGAGSILSLLTSPPSTIATFASTNGAMPYGGLIQARDGNFYGTTLAGGAYGGGTIYKLNTHPAIVSQSGNQTVPCGGNASFTVSPIAAMTPFVYQWFRNGQPLVNGADVSGATTSLLTVSNISAADVGAQYSVTVSNTVGSVSSATMTVTVPDKVPPVISLNGFSPTNVAIGSLYVDAGAAAFDLCAGPVGVATNNAVNTSVTGTYYVSYTAVDPSGNAVTNARAVNVLAPRSVQFSSSGTGRFSFPTIHGQSYTIQQTTNLLSTNWRYYTNFVGDGAAWQFDVPASQTNNVFFRVSEP